MISIVCRQKLFNKLLRSIHHSTSRSGYIVLVPEIGEDEQASDSILKPNGLPAFNNITIEHCLGAIGHQAVAVEKKVADIENQINENEGNIKISHIFKELDLVTCPLDTTWGIAKTLYLGNCTLIPTKSYMNIHERARNARASKFSSKTIYDIFMEMSTETSRDLKDDEERLLDKYLLEGKLNGLSLQNDQRNGLKEIILQLGKERASFKSKVNLSVHTFSHIISDYNLVEEFPLTVLASIAKDPNQASQGPWKITLQPQIVNSFLKYCPDRMHRWNVWQANARKASGQLEKGLDSSTHLEKIRELRQRQANLLGFPTFSSMSMQTKSVGSVAKIRDIFTKLLHYAGPAQSIEIDKLQQFAIENGFKHKLALYDVSYWQRKYLIAKYNCDEEQIRKYFSLPKVLSGLFSLSEKLFNIKIVERNDAEVWQPAVKYFDVYDCDVSTSTPVGGFFLDCYSKENKFGNNNGWMVSIRNRNKTTNSKPLSAIIFNFTSPEYGKPYLLSIDELCLVFKNFGSAMQHLLTKAEFTDLAGLSNIEWDASQICGQVMCNFLDRQDTLKSISSHIESDEQIPDSLASCVKLLKTNLAGFNLCREMYLADLDLELHQSTDFWLDVVKKLWPVYNCIPLEKTDAHPCSMTEIFSGDWASAQFSHLYSKILASDISDAFDEKTENAIIGKRFKETFLSSGGAFPSAEVFRRFRGRDPSIEAFLKSLNILNSQTSADL